MKVENHQLSNKEVRAFYDTAIADKYEGDYEFRRWHKHPQDRSDYCTTHEAISRRIGGITFSDYLELGPGPGTWTTLFFRQHPDAQFTLIDISKEMAKQFELEMRQAPNVRYLVADILDVEIPETFDFFFSSRALEYVDDKSKAIAKIGTLMRQNARGLLITKNPERGLRRRVDTRPLHRGQIAYTELKQLLEKHGFSAIEAYPAVVRVPLGRFLPSGIRLALAEALHRRLIDRRFSETPRWLSRITESYLVTFVKS